MFLVEKATITSHFKSITKKPSLIPKSYQQASRSFDEQVIFHLKTLAPATDSSFISLSWMSKAVAFLSTIHAESLDQISSLRSESECFQVLYMDYSIKLLDLCNLISSAVQQLTERRMLMNLSLRLMNSSGQITSGQIPVPEKLIKAKDALIRSVRHSEETTPEKYQRAKDLIGELISGINSFPIVKVTNGRDLIKRTLHGLGILTVFISSVLVCIVYGQSDLVEYRVPAEFLWSDSVNNVQKQMFNLIKSKSKLLELEDTASRVVPFCDLLDEASVLDGDGGEERRVRFVNGVREFGKVVTKYSNGVDELTNGVNGLFSSVLKTRNGVLDGVRKGVWLV
ncbi:protein BPS1, chloroplastic-like [Rutidosis leptorrhynchoides]|uniref:protein BPS1, chloroplastic-like n=1 Tax=Rutidosis leptorrhynchoides TaxID=125765 RepID=UPI003A9992C6